MMMARSAHMAARAMATDWRWPPENEATGTRMSCTMPTPSSRKLSAVRRRISGWLWSTRMRRRTSRPRKTLAAASRSGASARSW